MLKLLKQKNNQGFTLLEALVAVSILMVAVSAPITIAQRGLSSAIYSKDQMVATYLAQDAIEYIKNLRDKSSINSENYDWDALWLISGIDTCLNTGCQIDTISGRIIAYANTNYIKIDNNNFYQYESGVETKYTRKIQIERRTVGGQNDEALITVTVSWGETSLVVRTMIYNY